MTIDILAEIKGRTARAAEPDPSAISAEVPGQGSGTVLDESAGSAPATIGDRGNLPAGAQGSNYEPNKIKIPDDVEYYTPAELAELLRVNVRSLEKWIRHLPVVKVGHFNRFPRIEIQKRLLSGSLLPQKIRSKLK
ncbi:MAG: helix-turn-helix domain-containing protein [Chitinivibrionales bacterium]